MSAIADFVRLGILPGRCVDKTVALNLRTVMRMAEIDGRRPQNSEHTATQQSVGDVLGWTLWRNVDKAARPMPAWSAAWAAVVTSIEKESKPRGQSSLRGAANVQPQKVRPAANGRFAPDQRFVEKQAGSTDWMQRFPKGWPGLVTCATDEIDQKDVFLPAFAGLVAVHRAKLPRISSIVCDVNADGEVDPDARAYLHRMMRVVKEPFGDGNALAWQLGKEAAAGKECRGLVSDVREELVETEGSPTRVAQTCLGMASSSRGGPFYVPGPLDQHRQGTSGDGEPLGPLHLTTETIFIGPGGDCPILFEGEVQKERPGPHLVPVHLRHDASLSHGTGQGYWRAQAESVLYTIPPRKPPGGGGDWFPPTGPRPPQTPPTYPGGDYFPPLGPPRPPPGALSTALTPFSPAGIGPQLLPPPKPGTKPPKVPKPPKPARPPVKPHGPSKEDLVPGGFTPDGDPIPVNPEKPAGTPGGPIGPGRDYTPEFPTDPPPPPPIPPGTPHPFGRLEPTPQEREDQERKKREEERERLRREKGQQAFIGPSTKEEKWLAASTMEAAFPDVLFRPQHYGCGSQDLRNDVRPDPAEVERINRETPVVARMSAAFKKAGADCNRGEPTYTQRPGASRYPGGTAAGVIAILPPETSHEDAATDYAPAGIDLSEVHIVALAGKVFTGHGIPNPTTGGMKAGWKMSASGTTSSGAGTAKVQSVASDTTTDEVDVTRTSSTFKVQGATNLSGAGKGVTVQGGTGSTTGGAVALTGGTGAASNGGDAGVTGGRSTLATGGKAYLKAGSTDGGTAGDVALEKSNGDYLWKYFGVDNVVLAAGTHDYDAATLQLARGTLAALPAPLASGESYLATDVSREFVGV